MAGQVFSGPALLRKVRADFLDTWKTHYEAAKASLGRFCRMGLETDDFQTAFGYSETPIYPSRTNWGEAPEREPHRYRTYTVEQLRWTAEVEWLRRDRELSNLGSIDSDAMKAGRHFGTLFERVFFQILEATTDRKLLEVIDTAPDGAALFSATDGDSADRFGISGGNIVSGHSFTTGEGIRTGLYDALERMMQFQDPRGEPHIDAGLIEKGVTVIAPITLTKEFHEAFKQQLGALAASSATSNAGISNVIHDAGIKIHLWLTPRLTTTRMYVIADEVHGSDGNPLIAESVSLPLEENYYDRTNSVDHGRRGLEGVYWESWWAPVINLPLGAVRVTT